MPLAHTPRAPSLQAAKPPSAPQTLAVPPSPSRKVHGCADRLYKPQPCRILNYKDIVRQWEEEERKKVRGNNHTPLDSKGIEEMLERQQTLPQTRRIQTMRNLERKYGHGDRDGKINLPKTQPSLSQRQVRPHFPPPPPPVRPLRSPEHLALCCGVLIVCD